MTKRDTARRAAAKRRELREERILREIVDALREVMRANRKLLRLLSKHTKGEA